MEPSPDLEIPWQRRPVIDAPVPLTARQLRVWSFTTLRQNGWRRCAGSLRILGLLNTSLLRESIEAVLHRHEALRMRFVVPDGTPLQQVEPPRRWDLNVVELSALPADAAEREARSQAQTFAERKVSFSDGPLVDVRLYKLSAREHVLLLILDHMISDASSFEIVLREIWSFYRHRARGAEPVLPQLPLQFPDYALWQYQTRERWLQKEAGYWREHLAGVQPMQIPLDRPLQVENPVTHMLSFSFGEQLSARLRAFAEREQTRTALVVLTLYVAAMSRWCDREDVLFTFASHGRFRPELKPMVGYLATLPPLRVAVRRQGGLRELIKQVVAEFYSTHQHREFDRVPLLLPECTTELAFNWLPTSATYHFLPSNWAFNPTDLIGADDRARTDTALEMQPFPLRALWAYKFLPFFFDNGATDISVAIAHQPDVIEAGTVERFVHDLRLLATELVQD